MQQFLRIIGTLVSAEVFIKTFCLTDHLTNDAEKLADMLGEVKETLEEKQI